MQYVLIFDIQLSSAQQSPVGDSAAGTTGDGIDANTSGSKFGTLSRAMSCSA